MERSRSRGSRREGSKRPFTLGPGGGGAAQRFLETLHSQTGMDMFSLALENLEYDKEAEEVKSLVKVITDQVGKIPCVENEPAADGDPLPSTSRNELAAAALAPAKTLPPADPPTTPASFAAAPTAQSSAAARTKMLPSAVTAVAAQRLPPKLTNELAAAAALERRKLSQAQVAPVTNPPADPSAAQKSSAAAPTKMLPSAVPAPAAAEPLPSTSRNEPAPAKPVPSTSRDVSLMDKAVTPAVLKKDDEEPPKAVTSEVPPKPEPKKVDPSKAMPPKTVPPAVLKKDNEEPPKPGSSKAVPPAVLKNDEEPPKVEPPKPLPPVVLKSDKEPSKAMPPKTVPPAVLKKDNEEPPKPGPSKAMPPKPLPPTVLKKDDKNRKVRVDYIQFTRTEPSPVAVVAPLAFGREMQYFHYIQLKKMYTFRVSRVVSPADFCLMYVSERPPQREFEVSGAPDELGNISPTMWTDMQFFYKLDGIRTEYKLGTDPHKQQMYACREGEGSKEQYHRITILTKDTYNDRANVLFVDSGLRKLVNFDQLYELPVCFTDPPALAFKCSLADILPKDSNNPFVWSEDICTAFRNMTIGQRVTAVVHSKNVHHFEDTTVAQCHLSATLYLLDDPVTLQEKLITSGWARAAPKTAAAAATATPPN